jgi:hypothetical protein
VSERLSGVTGLFRAESIIFPSTQPSGNYSRIPGIIGCIHGEIIIEAPIPLTSTAARTLHDSMIDAGKMYLRDILVVVDVAMVENWWEKSRLGSIERSVGGRSSQRYNMGALKSDKTAESVDQHFLDI